MADESVRSLMVELGYDVDMTGADQFKASFKSLETSLASIADRMAGSIPNKRIGKKLGSLERRMNLFKSRMRRRLRGALKLSPGDFKNLEKNLSFIGEKVKAAFKKASIAAAAGAAAIVAAGTKVFKGFADIESAELTLEAVVGADADEYLAKLKEIRKATGEVSGELETIAAFTSGAQETDDAEFFINNMEKLIKLTKVYNRDLADTSGAIKRFIASGGNIDELVQLDLIGARQAEAIKAQGAPVGAAGIQERTRLIGGAVEERAKEIEPLFQKFLQSNQAVLDKSSAQIEKTVSVLGREYSGVIKKVFNGIVKVAKSIEEGSLEAIRGPKLQKSEAIDKSLRGAGPITFGAQGQGQSQSVTQTNTFHISGNDPEAIGTIVDQKMKAQNRNLQQIESRKKVSRALNTTIQTVPKQ